MLVLLIFSCGNDSAGGSVSEAGNAKLTCSILDSNTTAVPGLTVALVPADFDPVTGDSKELQFTLSNAEGIVSFETRSGTYNLWGQLGTELLFASDIVLNDSDTITLKPQKMKQSGTIALTDEEPVTTVFAKGFPFPFTLEKSAEFYYVSTIPEGTHTITIQNENEVVEKQSTIYANDTTIVSKQHSWTHWFPESHLNSSYSIHTSEDTLFVGTGTALGIYFNGAWKFLTATTEGIPSSWILGLTSFENNIYLATEKGAALFNGKTITPFNDIGELKMSRFIKRSNQLWYTAEEETGAIENGSVVERYSKTDIGTSNTILTVLPEADTLWVGTSFDGLYYKAGSSWTKDTSFSSNWTTTQLYFIDRFDEKLWLSTTESGIFCREDNQWTHYSTGSGHLPSDSIYATYVDSAENRLLFGTKEGHLVSYAEGTFETIDEFRPTIYNSGIFAIHRDKNKLYLGTYGQGLVVLE